MCLDTYTGVCGKLTRLEMTMEKIALASFAVFGMVLWGIFLWSLLPLELRSLLAGLVILVLGFFAFSMVWVHPTTRSAKKEEARP